MTIDELAERFDRAPATVRGWVRWYTFTDDWLDADPEFARLFDKYLILP